MRMFLLIVIVDNNPCREDCLRAKVETEGEKLHYCILHISSSRQTFVLCPMFFSHPFSPYDNHDT